MAQLPLDDLQAHAIASHLDSGIGLATCRRIVEGHGGQIWAEPAPGGGSTFTFTVPTATV